MKDITLIIPAKNEMESLPTVLSELSKFNYNIKVILEKNDLKTIESIKDKKCEIIFQKGNGYGNAINNGIEATDTDFFCIFNADGSFIPDEIESMFSQLTQQNADFVFASRYEKNSKSEDDTIVTLVGNFLFSKLGNIFFKLTITDILYTFVLGKTSSIKKLNLKQNDFRLCVELPIKAKYSNMKIISSPAHERVRIGGKKKVNAIKDGFLILSAMVKYYFNI